MYLPNKYTKWYNQIIFRALNRPIINGYTEKHHIIPKSFGGSNRKENLVNLTAREHFICHRLLTKMVTGSLQIKMVRAVWRMTVKGRDFQDRFYPNSRTYEYLRIQFGLLRKGKSTPLHVKDKISKANKGNTPWNKGVPRTPEEKLLISKKRKETAKIVGSWNTGKSHSTETLNKITERAKLRTKYTCPYCTKEVAGSNYYRWHGDNCKLK
jgi:hypothetical protein